MFSCAFDLACGQSHEYTGYFRPTVLPERIMTKTSESAVHRQNIGKADYRIKVRLHATICRVRSVSSIYIWSKNFSHSAYVKSEAKDGGHSRPKSMKILNSFHSIFLPNITFFWRIVSLNMLSVHKTIVFFFKSTSKHEKQ